MARIPKLDSAGKFLAADVNAQIDARTKATMRADLPALAKELKIGGVDGSVPIFPTLAEAQAWEAKNPGKKALTLEPSTPDTTAPNPGSLSVVESAETAALKVTGATDDRAVAGYAFSKDNGATWSAWQSAAEYTMTGLTKLTSYSFRHKVKDAAGNEAVGVAVTKTTLDAPFTGATDNFNDAADGAGGNRVTQTGGLNWIGGTIADYMSAPSARAVTAGKATAGSWLLTLPTERASIAFDYTVSATGIIRIAVASDGSTTRMAMIHGGEKAFKLYNGAPSGESVNKGACQDSGRALASYDGTNVTLSIDGLQVLSVPAPGVTGKRYGFHLGTSGATADNVEVKVL